MSKPLIDQDNWLEHGWVDTREVAEGFGVHMATVRLWITCYGLPAKRIGRRYLLHMPSVVRWIESKRDTVRGQSNRKLRATLNAALKRMDELGRIDAQQVDHETGPTDGLSNPAAGRSRRKRHGSDDEWARGEVV